jgi:hypothetical protein
MAHACNARYLGVRDHEDCSLRLAWTKSLWDPISIYKPDMVAVIPSMQENTGRRIMLWGQPREKTWDPIWKISETKRDGGVAQVVEHLHSQCEAQNSIARTSKKSGPFIITGDLKIFLLLFMGLGVEPRALHTLCKHSITELYLQPLGVLFGRDSWAVISTWWQYDSITEIFESWKETC